MGFNISESKCFTSDHRNNGGDRINGRQAPLQPREQGNGREDQKSIKTCEREIKMYSSYRIQIPEIFSYSTSTQPIKLYRFNLGLELVHSMTNTLKCNPMSENTIAFKS